MEENEELIKKIKESELDALYFYLHLNMDQMNDDEILAWKAILEKLDPEFYAD